METLFEFIWRLISAENRTSQSVVHTSGEVVLSEMLHAHLEGAAGYRGWELVAFIDGLRDIDRELQEAKVGYAVEVPEVLIVGW